jgi:uncharacterized RDD family membrane protein YckC
MTDSNHYAPPQAPVSDVSTDQQQERADRWVRLAASILDFIIAALTILPAILGIGFGVALAAFNDKDLAGLFTASGAVIGIAISGLLWLGWLAAMTYFVHTNGQTIAKKILGIKVVRSNGSRATLARIFFLRYLVNVLPSWIPVIGFFYSWLIDPLFIFGEKQQCVHDLIADTIVVKA